MTWAKDARVEIDRAARREHIACKGTGQFEACSIGGQVDHGTVGTDRSGEAYDERAFLTISGHNQPLVWAKPEYAVSACSDRTIRAGQIRTKDGSEACSRRPIRVEPEADLGEKRHRGQPRITDGRRGNRRVERGQRFGSTSHRGEPPQHRR